MKVTNWRRKLMASLVAGGLAAPTAVSAANLNTNLLANPGFENVDFGTTGDYGSPMILGWSGGPGFAYSHAPDTTGIPDYADGADPPDAGLWYFTANNNPGSPTGDWRAPDLVFQDIDVSTGPTGTQIGIGEAAYKLSAFMSSYLNDNDRGNVQLDFKNSGGTTIGTAIITDPDFGPNNVWSQTSAFGLVPLGTASVRVSIYGTVANGGTDGYIDNVDVRVTNAADDLLFLEVNTATGQTAIKNQTGDTVHIDYYEITSAGNSLNATAWNSLQEQNLAGFPAGNGTGNGWEQAGGSDAGVVGESYLTNNSGVSNSATIGLGAAYNASVNAQDLVFQYGAILDAAAAPTGDYNGNGVVDAADYTVWRDNFGASITLPNDSTPGSVTQDDFTEWKNNFGNAGGPSGPGTLVQGFVRYVGGAGSASAVPEPNSVLLVGIGLASLIVGGWRKSTN